MSKVCKEMEGAAQTCHPGQMRRVCVCGGGGGGGG